MSDPTPPEFTDEEVAELYAQFMDEVVEAHIVTPQSFSTHSILLTVFSAAVQAMSHAHALDTQVSVEMVKASMQGSEEFAGEEVTDEQAKAWHENQSGELMFVASACGVIAQLLWGASVDRDSLAAELSAALDLWHGRVNAETDEERSEVREHAIGFARHHLFLTWVAMRKGEEMISQQMDEEGKVIVPPEDRRQ